MKTQVRIEERKAIITATNKQTDFHLFLTAESVAFLNNISFEIANTDKFKAMIKASQTLFNAEEETEETKLTDNEVKSLLVNRNEEILKKYLSADSRYFLNDSAEYYAAYMFATSDICMFSSAEFETAVHYTENRLNVLTERLNRFHKDEFDSIEIIYQQ